MFLSVNGGHSWILRHHLLGDPPLMFLSIDGGRSRISITASQGGPQLTFLALMLGAPRSLAPPPKGPTVDVSKH
jgi:hypothetical protein